MIGIFLNWLKSFFYNKSQELSKNVKLRFEQLYGFETVEGDLPSVLKPSTLYLVTENNIPWEAAMICPCGCGARIELNLLPDEYPRWRYRRGKNHLPTLYPSIDRLVGCKSHFFLQDGQILWAGNRNRENLFSE
jgi:hypothetical protein